MKTREGPSIYPLIRLDTVDEPARLKPLIPHISAAGQRPSTPMLKMSHIRTTLGTLHLFSICEGVARWFSMIRASALAAS